MGETRGKMYCEEIVISDAILRRVNLEVTLLVMATGKCERMIYHVTILENLEQISMITSGEVIVFCLGSEYVPCSAGTLYTVTSNTTINSK